MITEVDQIECPAKARVLHQNKVKKFKTIRLEFDNLMHHSLAKKIIYSMSLRFMLSN